MKKVTYLLLVMFATLLLTASCEEDEDLTPDVIITQAEFSGMWSFIEFELDGESYDVYNIDCENFTYTMNSELDFFMFKDQIEIYGRNQDGIILKYVLEDNIIKINSYRYQYETTDNISLELKLLSYDKTNKILKLKLGSNFSCYSEGILTIKRIQGL
jgi:hypothetical protein